MYKPLFYLKVNQDSRTIEKIDKLIEDGKIHKIAVALGQVVQLCIHFSTALNVVLKNPVVFNGYRSQIHSEETIERRYDPFKLYIIQKNDQKSLCRGLELLEENLHKIKRSLN